MMAWKSLLTLGALLILCAAADAQVVASPSPVTGHAPAIVTTGPDLPDPDEEPGDESADSTAATTGTTGSTPPAVVTTGPGDQQPPPRVELPGPTVTTTPTSEPAKGLRWREVFCFSPAFTPVDEKLIARLEKTSKLKLKYLRRNASFAAHFNPDPALRAQWKKLAEECKRILDAR